MKAIFAKLRASRRPGLTAPLLDHAPARRTARHPN
jgi:hypothetical protein